MRFGHRVTTLVLALALLVGHVGVCPGWAATPEARMACCADGGMCPMRHGDAEDSGAGDESSATLTQAQADGCCAASEEQDSSASNPLAIVAITSAVLGDGIVIPERIPALVLSDHWRRVAPLPTMPVPRHVLLSVFLV